jgi:hypothetical protein
VRQRGFLFVRNVTSYKIDNALFKSFFRDDLNVFIDKLDETERLEREEVSQSGKKNKKAVAAQGKGGAKGGRVARAMVAEYAPSPRGERIAPRIDEMIKKAEAADKAKENKGKGRTKKVKILLQQNMNSCVLLFFST